MSFRTSADRLENCKRETYSSGSKKGKEKNGEYRLQNYNNSHQFNWFYKIKLKNRYFVNILMQKELKIAHTNTYIL